MNIHLNNTESDDKKQNKNNNERKKKNLSTNSRVIFGIVSVQLYLYVKKNIYILQNKNVILR